MADEDDMLVLPADTLKILNDFLHEKAEREELENKGKDAKFEEDWQLSQFWYNESTKQQLANAVKKLIDKSVENSVALLSCPSLYAAVKEVHTNVKIFEFDPRFQAYGEDFVLYDFNDADTEQYLSNYWHQFDIIIADPPFLSEECIMKISKVIKNLMRPSAKIIFCSGEIVEPWLKQYLNLAKCIYRPEHERNLGNEFISYANFNFDDFIKKS